MMELIGWYFLMGLVVGFVMDVLARKLASPLTLSEHIGTIIFWPIMVVVFIISFIIGIIRGGE